MKPHLRPAVLLALSALTFSLMASAAEGVAGPPAGRARPVGNPAFARLPLAFEANRGQTDPSVAFMARGAGSAIFLRPDGAVISRSAQGEDQAVVRVAFEGAKPAPVLQGEGPLGGIVNYYRGSSPASWIERVPCFSKVRYRNLYPGIDCAFYGNGSELEFDLLVAPGARPEDIALRFRDRAGKPLRPVLDGAGGLILMTPEGDFSQRLPKVWQERYGVRTGSAPVTSLRPSGTVGVALDSYDRTRPVVIDPTMVFSTYLGGSSGEYATGVRLDTIDDPIVVGSTSSTNFPVTDGSSLHGTSQDVFVTMMDFDGSGLVFSTIFGGSSTDMARDVALDDNDAIYVTGQTNSSDFPVLGGYPFTSQNPSKQSGFLTRLSPLGVITYSTLIRGSNPYSAGTESGSSVTAVAPGKVFVGGSTTSTDFLVYGSPIQSTLHGTQDGFLWAVNTNLTGTSSLTYSTFLGGSGIESINGVSYFFGDLGDEIFITGTTDSSDFPVSQLGAYQSSLAGGTDGFFGAIVLPLVGGPPQVQYMTYLGGSGQDIPERVKALSRAVVCVTGYTASGNFPLVTPYQGTYGGGAYDAFVTFFDTTVLGSSSVIYSTYLGGSQADFAYGASVDLGNGFYIVGTTSSANFPMVDPIPGLGTFQGGPEDAFVAHIAYPVYKPQKAPSMAPTLYSSTYLGGTGDDWAEAVAVDTLANAVVVGGTTSTDFPTLYPFQASKAGSSDVFVSSISTASQQCSVACTAGAAPSSGAAPLTVNFTSTASPSNCVGTPTFAWSFGDTQTSTLQNPSHIYNNNGTYNWTLTVTADTATCTKSGTVTVSSTCTTSCSATVPTTGTVGVTIPFSSTVTPTNCVGSPAFTWSFGDGSPTSSQQNPGHAYVAAGTYSWSMTVVVGGVGCTKSGSILISPACAVSCTASVPASSSAGASIGFSGTVTPTNCVGTPTFVWSFGDGSPVSTAQNTTHIYAAAGSYNWSMTVTVGGVDCNKSGSILISPACAVSCFASVPSTGTVGASIGFAGTVTPTNCVGTPAFTWSFGDGSPLNTSQNATHIYTAAGSYNWSMTVTVGGVGCTKSGSILISPGCSLNCSASAPTGAAVGQAVPFASSATPVGCTGTLIYLWDFGNGDTATEANPTYTYYVGGTFNWTFTATIGAVTCTKTGTISICDLQVTAAATP